MLSEIRSIGIDLSTWHRHQCTGLFLRYHLKMIDCLYACNSTQILQKHSLFKKIPFSQNNVDLFV